MKQSSKIGSNLGTFWECVRIIEFIICFDEEETLPLGGFEAAIRPSHEQSGPTSPDETRATSVYRGVG